MDLDSGDHQGALAEDHAGHTQSLGGRSGTRGGVTVCDAWPPGQRRANVAAGGLHAPVAETARDLADMPGPGNRRQSLVRRPARSHQGPTIAQAGSGRAGPGPDTLGTLAKALDGLFAVLAGTLEPGDWRHCAGRVLVRTVRCLHRIRRVMI
jgi:hypothetical protein